MARAKHKQQPAWFAALRIIVAVVIIGGGLLSYRACDGFGQKTQQGRQVVKLVRVADGDTVVVQPAFGDSVRVRLMGIDTPELGNAASFESAHYLAVLLEDASKIELEIDPGKPRDKYGRALGWLWVTTKDGQELLAQEELINAGLAEIYRDAKGSLYFERLQLAERHRR